VFHGVRGLHRMKHSPIREGESMGHSTTKLGGSVRFAEHAHSQYPKQSKFLAVCPGHDLSKMEGRTNMAGILNRPRCPFDWVVRSAALCGRALSGPFHK